VRYYGAPHSARRLSQWQRNDEAEANDDDDGRCERAKNDVLQFKKQVVMLFYVMSLEWIQAI